MTIKVVNSIKEETATKTQRKISRRRENEKRRMMIETAATLSQMDALLPIPDGYEDALKRREKKLANLEWELAGGEV